jgi:hypothetical protein
VHVDQGLADDEDGVSWVLLVQGMHRMDLSSRVGGGYRADTGPGSELNRCPTVARGSFPQRFGEANIRCAWAFHPSGHDEGRPPPRSGRPCVVRVSPPWRRRRPGCR